MLALERQKSLFFAALLFFSSYTSEESSAEAAANSRSSQLTEGQGVPIADPSRILIPLGGHTGVYSYVPLNFSCASGSVIYASAPTREMAINAFAPGGKAGRMLLDLWYLYYVKGSSAPICASWDHLILHVYYDANNFIRFRIDRNGKDRPYDWGIRQLGAEVSPQYLHHIVSGWEMPKSVSSTYRAILEDKDGDTRNIWNGIPAAEMVWFRQDYHFTKAAAGTDLSALAKSASSYPFVLRMAHLSNQPPLKRLVRPDATDAANDHFATLIAAKKSKGDVAQSLAALKRLSEAGDPHADHLIAIALKLRFLSADEAGGDELFYVARAASLGRIEAAIDYALLHLEGTGGAERNLALAVTILRDLTDQARGKDGDPSGRAHLALASLLANDVVRGWAGNSEEKVRGLFLDAQRMATDPVIREAAIRGFNDFGARMRQRADAGNALLVGAIVTGIALLALSPSANKPGNPKQAREDNFCDAFELARMLSPKDYELPLALFGCGR